MHFQKLILLEKNIHERGGIDPEGPVWRTVHGPDERRLARSLWQRWRAGFQSSGVEPNDQISRPGTGRGDGGRGQGGGAGVQVTSLEGRIESGVGHRSGETGSWNRLTQSTGWRADVISSNVGESRLKLHV